MKSFLSPLLPLSFPLATKLITATTGEVNQHRWKYYKCAVSGADQPSLQQQRSELTACPKSGQDSRRRLSNISRTMTAAAAVVTGGAIVVNFDSEPECVLERKRSPRHSPIASFSSFFFHRLLLSRAGLQSTPQWLPSL